MEREYDYMIWKETQLGNTSRVRQLRSRLEEYQVLVKNGDAA